ncbi:MAG: pyrimidine 5'-nucleotidase [Chloroflexi bacterium]|nr:pyrimidine 5'-nucleotidase [Chloroflexota bacterium]
MITQIDTLLFDLDATLYPKSNGLWEVIRERMVMYMHDRLNIPLDRIDSIRDHYYVTYGTTLQGLQAHYEFDPRDYLDYVHNIPLDDFIQPDKILRKMLLSIPHRCWIFTNSDKDHTLRVLKALEIDDCFEGIIDVWTISPYCKPQREAFKMALKHANISDPGQCIFLDDSPRNLSTAHDMGIFTILVGENGNHPSADRCMEVIHDLTITLPEIWR